MTLGEDRHHRRNGRECVGCVGVFSEEGCQGKTGPAGCLRYDWGGLATQQQAG